jgi:hypothetical protein
LRFLGRLLRPGDPTPRLCGLLADGTIPESDRFGILARLGQLPGDTAVPTLLKIVADDRTGWMVCRSLDALEHHPGRESVTGLIRAIDFQYDNRKPAAMIAFDPEMFQDRVVRALRTITGESFGPDSSRWNVWWQQRGQYDARFK